MLLQRGEEQHIQSLPSQIFFHWIAQCHQVRTGRCEHIYLRVNELVANGTLYNLTDYVPLQAIAGIWHASSFTVTPFSGYPSLTTNTLRQFLFMSIKFTIFKELPSSFWRLKIFEKSWPYKGGSAALWKCCNWGLWFVLWGREVGWMKQNVSRSGRQCKPILNVTFSNYSSEFLKPFVFFNLQCKIVIFNYLLPPLDVPSLDPPFSFY